MMSTFSLMPNDKNIHSLLEPPMPAYTTATIRRALIVWLHCGQQNEFRHVCNYYHQLESMEEKMSAEARAASRMLEFNLLTKYPPTSQFLIEHFPKLYQHTKNSKVNITEVQEVSLDDCVFNLKGFHDLEIQKGTSTKFILETSQMIKNYSKTHSKPLRTLLTEFQDFVKKTEAKNSVDHIAMHIKQKFLKDELVTWSTTPKSFDFLDLDDTHMVNDSGMSTLALEDNQGPTLVIDAAMNVKKDADNIKILTNDARKQELFGIIKDAEKSIEDEEEIPGNAFYEFFRNLE